MSRHVGITHLACVPNTSRMCARHNTQTLLYLVLYYSPSLISFNDKALMRAHSSMRCLLLIQSWHTLLSPLCLPHLALLSQAVLQLPPAAAGPRVDHRQGAGECGRLPVMEEVSSCGRFSVCGTHGTKHQTKPKTSTAVSVDVFSYEVCTLSAVVYRALPRGTSVQHVITIHPAHLLHGTLPPWPGWKGTML